MLHVLFGGLSMLCCNLDFLFQEELVKKVGKETVDDRTTVTGGEAPAGGGAAVLAGEIGAAAAVEEGTPRPPEDTEDIPAVEEADPRSAEAVAFAEAPQV
jgi:hypothetical protein